MRTTTMNLLKRIMTSDGKARLRVVAASSVLMVLLGAVSAYAYFSRRVSTDDAQVDAHIAPIAAKVGGNVSDILVADNQLVHAGDVSIRVITRPGSIRPARPWRLLKARRGARTRAFR